MQLLRIALWGAYGHCVLGCGPKEAADPHEMLAEDYERAEGVEPHEENVPPATRAECEAAVRHVYALGGGDAASSDGKQHIKDSLDECVARGTSQREAQCIARIRSESEIEGCSR